MASQQFEVDDFGLPIRKWVPPPEETDKEQENCPEWVCGSNGTQLNGIALQGVTWDGIRAHETQVHDQDDLLDMEGDSQRSKQSANGP